MKTTAQDLVTVKQVFDIKGPLKGKGGTLAHWQSDAEARLREVYAEMEQLAQESRSVAGRHFGLQICKLRDALQLRWRMTDGRHVTWARVEPLLAGQAPGLAQWYRQAEEVAQILNHRGQILRYEIKTVKRLIAVGAQPLRALRGQVGRGVGGGRPPANHSLV